MDNREEDRVMNIQRHANSRKHSCANRRTVTLLLAIVLASTTVTHAELYGFRQMQNGTPGGGHPMILTTALLGWTPQREVDAARKRTGIVVPEASRAG